MDNEMTQPAPKAEAPAGVRTTGGALLSFKPLTFPEMEHMAQVLAKSDIVPKDLINKPANVLLVLMFGNEIGITPSQALQNVMVVNGRPSLWGDAVMGLVLASDVYENSKDEFDEKTMTAKFLAKRKGKDWVVRTFSQADAVKAGLWTKEGPWQKYPKRMLFHRARSWALRDSFADVLKGLRYYEEERDIINMAPEGETKVYSMPKQLPAEAAAAAPASEPAAAETPAQEAPAEPAKDALPDGHEIAEFVVTSRGDAELAGSEYFYLRHAKHRYYTDKATIVTLGQVSYDKKKTLRVVWRNWEIVKGEVIRWIVSAELVEEKGK